jgi:hypothetical protein
MIEGHVHQVMLEQRAGVDYLAIIYVAGLRDECERQRSTKQLPTPVSTRYATPIAGTTAIAQAFNQGDSAWLRADPVGRDARQSLLQFLHEHPAEDGRWALMMDDFRRFASLPLCTP